MSFYSTSGAGIGTIYNLYEKALRYLNYSVETLYTFENGEAFVYRKYIETYSRFKFSIISLEIGEDPIDFKEKFPYFKVCFSEKYLEMIKQL